MRLRGTEAHELDNNINSQFNGVSKPLLTLYDGAMNTRNKRQVSNIFPP